YQNLAGGTELSCQVFFNNPTPYSLSPQGIQDFPQINTLVQQINSNLTDLIIAKTPYNDFCNTRTPVDPANLTGTTGTLERVISQLAEINTTLTALENEPTATPPPTETLTPTPVQEPATPEIAPTATLNARPHLQELQRIIDDVTASTGANSVLKIYWEDAQRAGRTDGCVTPPPVIPADYFLSPADAAQNPSLAQAVSAVNLGLGNVRSGWSVFKQACDSGNPGLSAQSGLGFVQTANDAFNAALALFPAAMQGG
ncbi:MAG: hypothetical protein K8I60_00730, partial [Anaerolineae bacterium]|nr:hypothetical protein [Anaerolineae bacterium]